MKEYEEMRKMNEEKLLNSLRQRPLRRINWVAVARLTHPCNSRVESLVGGTSYLCNSARRSLELKSNVSLNGLMF